jgi:hypothetical protein
MERVLGIGGYFIKASDPKALMTWYRQALGLDLDEMGLWQPEAGPISRPRSGMSSSNALPRRRRRRSRC